MKDLVAFASQELKSEPILTHREERHFESVLTVKSKTDLGAFGIPKTINVIGRVLSEKVGIQYQPAGIIMNCDTEMVKTRRKPAHFVIDRKVGFSFAENLFHCIAPLRTREHIELLNIIEQEAETQAAQA